MDFALILLTLLNIIIIFLLLKRKTDHSAARFDAIGNALERLEKNIKDEFRYLQENTSKGARENREELSKSLGDFRTENSHILKTSPDKICNLWKRSTRRWMNRSKSSRKYSQKTSGHSTKCSAKNSESLTKSRANCSNPQKSGWMKCAPPWTKKLQKTLHERIGQSFELVSKQLEHVQKGLGEMQNLAQDVGGLKKVLGNVKMRGSIGEVQLEMLLEQILAPEQYEANVKTKKGSDKLVEFAIKLPGREDHSESVYLPVDAKFPKDAYEQLVEAYESGQPEQIDAASRNIEATIKNMAKDIHDKYLDPPYTTDFGIMFLPFEAIYGEVVRRASLLEQLQRDYKVIVTGPTTLAAILNSLQMGFRTLAIQKRSSEVWKVLGAVKTEFEKFGGMLEKAQKNIQTANNQIEEVMGKRTRAIQRRLRDIEALPSAEAALLIPEAEEADDLSPEN